MIIMQYANGGDLHYYLQNNFFYISWYKKLDILKQISQGYLYFASIYYLYLNLDY